VGLRLLIPPSLGAIAASARADALAQWMSEVLGEPVEAEVAPDYGALERAIREASFELVWAPPAICPAVVLHVRAIFRPVRKGNRHYHAAIVARRGELETLYDLRGRRAAWVDPRSAAGYLLVADALVRSGMNLDDDLANQTFYGSFTIAIRAVLSHKADFASIYAADPTEEAARSSLRRAVADAEQQLDVVAFTAAAPSDGLVITRHDRAEATLAAVKRLIAAADERPDAPLLAAFDAETFVRAGPRDYGASDVAQP
jgi:ABC-type phosphate/phosphonate transport system substrate-binding protein